MALGLALVAAVAHAALGALQKGRHDPWLSRGAVDVCAGLGAIPLILFVVPPPGQDLWLLFPAVLAMHLAFKWVIAMAYSRGAFTAVYPIVRGTGPIVTVLFAGIVFGEFFSAVQWLGVALLSGATFGLAAFNLTRVDVGVAVLKIAIGLAVLTGVLTAFYTILDAFAIRTTPDPFTFLAWFFFLEMFVFPVLLWSRWRAAGPGLHALFARGALGAAFAYTSFGSIFIAIRLDTVGEAAALRETSVIFSEYGSKY